MKINKNLNFKKTPSSLQSLFVQNVAEIPEQKSSQLSFQTRISIQISISIKTESQKTHASPYIELVSRDKKDLSETDFF